jgi:hypothetical protein
MRISAIVTLLALLTLGAAVVPREAEAAFPGENGRIVYKGPDGITTMAADGSDIRVVFPSTAIDFGRSPEWSPGGTMIVFSRIMQGNADIWRMNADGSGLVRLTRHAGADEDPAWSADGEKIAFSSDRTGDEEIYSMRIDGTGLQRLTTRPGWDRDPVWSPNNDRIAFVSDLDGGPEASWQISSVRPDGSDMRRVVGQEAYEDNLALDPDWSSDGTRIAWGRPDYPHHGGISEVVVATGVRRTLDEPDFAHSSDGVGYAPDATGPVPDAIVFSYISGDSRDIGVRSSAPGGTESVRLTSTPGYEWDPDWQPIPEFPLVDARFSSFEAEIEWLYGAGITTGCSSERFCPDDRVTRAQMASFLVRALELPSTSTDSFTDDGASSHQADINALAAAGVTTGCAPARYCPTGTVSREQMASFLARALDLPATTTDHFRDDESSSHEADINRLASAGITSGCSKDRYCPKQPVTRGQMAAFLYRALDEGE